MGAGIYIITQICVSCKTDTEQILNTNIKTHNLVLKLTASNFQLWRGAWRNGQNVALYNVPGCVRFQTPLGAGYSEKYHVSPLSKLELHFDIDSLGKVLYPHMLHSGVNEYLVEQRWQCVR